jgi:hypothetical protein
MSLLTDHEIPDRLYVDGINMFNINIYYKYTHFLSELKDNILDFVNAAKASNYELKVFIDAVYTSQTQEWKDRQWKTLLIPPPPKTYSIPSAGTFIGDIFKSHGIQVLYTIRDNDDVLAYYANDDNAIILSKDRDFLCYQPRKYRTSHGYHIKGGKLILTRVYDPSDYMPPDGVFKRRVVRKIPENVDDWVYESNYPYLLEAYIDSVYRRGWFGPKMYVRQYRNIMEALLPLIRSAFHDLDITADYDILVVRDDEISWISDTVDPIKTDVATMTIDQIYKATFRSTYAPSYVLAAKIAIAELMAPVWDKTVTEVCTEQSIG